MAYISAPALNTVRRFSLRRLSFPMFKIGATLAAAPGLMGDALKLAYVAPYTALHRESQVVPDDELEGRDPDW